MHRQGLQNEDRQAGWQLVWKYLAVHYCCLDNLTFNLPSSRAVITPSCYTYEYDIKADNTGKFFKFVSHMSTDSSVPLGVIVNVTFQYALFIPYFI